MIIEFALFVVGRRRVFCMVLRSPRLEQGEFCLDKCSVSSARVLLFRTAAKRALCLPDSPADSLPVCLFVCLVVGFVCSFVRLSVRLVICSSVLGVVLSSVCPFVRSCVR